MTVDRVFRARRAIVGDVETSAAVGVAGGRIAIIAPFEAPVDAGEVIELDDDEVLLPGSSTRTSTSTSRAGPSGKASTRPPAPRRPAGSRRSSTCR